MADKRPQMLLLIDENVPDSVAKFFAARGHEIRFVRDLFPGGTPDPVIATWGNRVSAFHYQQALDRDDIRMIVQIQENGFKAW